MDVFIYAFREKKTYTFGPPENLMHTTLLMLDLSVILSTYNTNENKT